MDPNVEKLITHLVEQAEAGAAAAEGADGLDPTALAATFLFLGWFELSKRSIAGDGVEPMSPVGHAAVAETALSMLDSIYGTLSEADKLELSSTTAVTTVVNGDEGSITVSAPDAQATTH